MWFFRPPLRNFQPPSGVMRFSKRGANILKKVTKLAPKNVLGKYCINNGQGLRPPSTSSAVGKAPPRDAREGAAPPPGCPGGSPPHPTPPCARPWSWDSRDKKNGNYNKSVRWEPHVGHSSGIHMAPIRVKWPGAVSPQLLDYGNEVSCNLDA